LLRLSGSAQAIRYEPAGPTFVTHRIGCPRRAERDLNFRWSVGLEEGMRSLIEWRRLRERPPTPEQRRPAA
jgi:UDP-glucose 4-epimerase